MTQLRGGPPRSSSYRMANALLGGRLPQRLRRLRQEGVSYEEIARRLHGEGVEVSVRTLTIWSKQLGIHKGDEAA